VCPEVEILAIHKVIMERKFIHWIKDNCWIIAGILLAGNIIYVYFSDKYYFYNSQNVRYTIAKYKDTNFLVGKNPKIQYDFSYEVNGNSYNTYTRATLSNYNLEEDKLLIKYSAKMHGAGQVVKVVVPKWVLAPPKDGWKQFPPDINWKGAELDTAYMRKMNIEIP
jgi:hypothetical protein